MGGVSPAGGLASVRVAVCTIEKANNLINRLIEEEQLSDLGTTLPVLSSMLQASLLLTRCISSVINTAAISWNSSSQKFFFVNACRKAAEKMKFGVVKQLKIYTFRLSACQLLFLPYQFSDHGLRLLYIRPTSVLFLSQNLSTPKSLSIA